MKFPPRLKLAHLPTAIQKLERISTEVGKAIYIWRDDLTGFVADLMKDAYPELLDSIQRVARVVKDEEGRYRFFCLEDAVRETGPPT